MGDNTVQFDPSGCTVLSYFVLSRSVRKLHQSKSAFILYEAILWAYVNFDCKSKLNIITLRGLLVCQLWFNGF